MKKQPWTKKKEAAAALRNEHVRIGERTLGDGTRLRGLYATKNFTPGEQVASYHGRVFSREEFFAIHNSDPDLFERIIEYGVEAPTGHLYQPDTDAVGAHLTNHSCGPNTRWGSFERGIRLIEATKPIAAGEEITVHYGWVGLKAAMEKRWHACACTAPYCAKTIELKLEYIEEETNDGSRQGGPFLPPEEIANRFTADIVNDTNVNETALHGYAENSASLYKGVKIISGIDNMAFFQKLRDAARVAIHAAANLPVKTSSRRIAQIVHRYELDRAF